MDVVSDYTSKSKAMRHCLGNTNFIKSAAALGHIITRQVPTQTQRVNQLTKTQGARATALDVPFLMGQSATTDWMREVSDSKQAARTLRHDRVAFGATSTDTNRAHEEEENINKAAAQEAIEQWVREEEEAAEWFEAVEYVARIEETEYATEENAEEEVNDQIRKYIVEKRGADAALMTTENEEEQLFLKLPQDQLRQKTAKKALVEIPRKQRQSPPTLTKPITPKKRVHWHDETDRRKEQRQCRSGTRKVKK